MNSYLEIGALGWLHPAWTETYYSEDVPEDWRFAFYSKEFRTAVLAAEDFDYCTSDESGDWLEDLYEGFLLFVELDMTRLSDSDWHKRLQQLVKQLDRNLGGFILGCDDAEAVREKISSGQLDQVMANSSIHLDVPRTSTALNELVSHHESLHWCWNPGLGAGQAKSTGDKNCQVVLLESADLAADLRALSGIFQDFRSQNEVHETLFVFFTGEPPGIGLMKQAQSVAVLLGAA